MKTILAAVALCALVSVRAHAQTPPPPSQEGSVTISYVWRDDGNGIAKETNTTGATPPTDAKVHGVYLASYPVASNIVLNEFDLTHGLITTVIARTLADGSVSYPTPALPETIFDAQSPEGDWLLQPAGVSQSQTPWSVSVAVVIRWKAPPATAPPVTAPPAIPPAPTISWVPPNFYGSDPFFVFVSGKWEPTKLGSILLAYQSKRGEAGLPAVYPGLAEYAIISSMLPAMTGAVSAEQQAAIDRALDVFISYTKRIAVLVGTKLYVKEGKLDAVWTLVTDGAQAFSVFASRIAVLTGTSLYVKEGPLNAPWTLVANNAQAFALSEDRIGVLDGTTLYVKEGAVSAPWTLVANNAKSFALSGRRIGVLSGASLHVKEGRLDGPWTLIANDTQAFKLSGDRIGTVNGSGTLFVKEGGLGAQWTLVANNTKGFALSGKRIAVLDGISLQVKEGTLGAPWTTVAGNSATFDIAGNRIAELENGALHIKEGGLGGQWTLVANCQAFALSAGPLAGQP